jgi:hypothetical protein
VRQGLDARTLGFAPGYRAGQVGAGHQQLARAGIGQAGQVAACQTPACWFPGSVMATSQPSDWSLRQDHCWGVMVAGDDGRIYDLA